MYKFAYFFFYPKCGIMTLSYTKEVIMRKDVQALINFHREEAELLNKSEIARRMNCDIILRYAHQHDNTYLNLNRLKK